MSKTFSVSLVLAALVGMTACSSSDDSTTQNAQEVTTLRFSHFWPATSTTNTEILEYWAKKVEEDSQGRIQIEIFPSATLSKTKRNL